MAFLQSHYSVVFYVLEALRGFPLLQIHVCFDFMVVLVDVVCVDVGSDLLRRRRPELLSII